MKRTVIGTTVALTIFLIGITQWRADVAVAAERARWEQANAKAGVWMEATTAKLERINAGVERITGELVEIAQRVDNLESRP